MPVIDFGDADRTAKRAAEIVAAISRPVLSRAHDVAAERIAGIQVFVDEVVVAAAVIWFVPDFMVMLITTEPAWPNSAA